MNLTIELRAKPEKFQELYQSLQALLPTMRKENGCREAHIYRDVEDGEVFSLSMSWEDAAKFENYMQSTSGSALLGAVDLLSKAVRVRMGDNTPWDGIEVLKRVRKGA
ncbi:Antibiotic biosynthesis monooxygenase [Syntrophus gentianae]|uniref:Antibiotic biosynthesis monooxygenase n=1 Tax=Syntrophus gentianae TaxID=43775 RepID=A0A1H7VYG5_9BACT|nr:antibiotic biosynthesis monooxygenase family protein [Syntrophus gentianae]SEM13827.1 Antibiotic biosynthesis monooxygenase [Syntrophus gentianae]